MLDYLRLMSGPDGEVFDVVSQKEGPLGEDLAALGLRVQVSDVDDLRSASAYEDSVQKTLALLVEGDFDVVWANSLVSFPGVDAALRVGIPSLWFVHEALDPALFWGPSVTDGSMSAHAYDRCLVALRAASVVVCVAEAGRLMVERHRRSRVAVLPNSIDLASIDAYQNAHDRVSARRKLGLADDERLVLCCGAIAPHKGQAVLAQAVTRIALAHPRVVCAMVGDVGHPYARGIAAYVESVGLDRRVRIEPLVQQIYPWYRAADLFVLPSDEEALPSVVLEAMTFGVPVVATNVGGIPEIADGDNSFLSPSNDVASLSEALDQALSAHPALLQSKAAAARRRVEDHHSAVDRVVELRRLIFELAHPDVDFLKDVDDPDGLGADVAFAIDADLRLEGIHPGPILHVGQGVKVAFQLARWGYSVTSTDLDVDTAGRVLWRSRAIASRTVGSLVSPELSPLGLRAHLAKHRDSYGAALVFPGSVPDAPGQEVGDLLRLLIGRADRAYVRLPVTFEPAPDEDGFLHPEQWVRDVLGRATLVASTVGPGCEPIRVCRIDLR
ncbi:MAG: glycosyltransferase family 4 protein [Candidatus Dormibacteraceae bacterium]